MSETNIEKYSAEEWNFIRKRFTDSILKETEIGKLGQNVGISWPFKGKGETPARYIDFDFDELQSVPGLVGKKSRIKVLMNILRETLAFDDPFGDMVDTVESGNLDDLTFDRMLAKVEIAEDYPVAYLHFSEETKELLKNEGVSTLIECVHFGQKLDPSSLAGGDIKGFLNSLAHKDEQIMAKHIPYRPGARGLHIAEAIGLICEGLDAPAKLHLMKQGGFTLSNEERETLAASSELDIEASIKSALDKFIDLLEWFDTEALEEAFAEGGSPERFFITINEPRRERMAVELSKLHFGSNKEKKSGFLGRIFGG